MRTRALLPLALTAPLAAITLLAAPGVATAADSASYQANLNVVGKNSPGSSGTAMVTVNGDQATVTINTTGLINAPHAAHIHIGGAGTCPTAAADADGNGLVSVAEGMPAYGPIKVSLTTSGDVSAKSGLAVKRFPTYAGGAAYSRTFTLPTGVSAADVAKGVVVVHGVDTVMPDGKYDGAQKSSIDPSLPAEATTPAICGKLVASQASAAAGGAQTGAGGTSGLQDPALYALGGGLLVAAGGVAVARRRKADA